MNDTTTASAPSTPRRRRKSRRGLVFALVVIVAAGGWYGVNKYLHRADKEGEYLFSAVATGDIEDLVTSTGTLQPRDYVDVGAQVSGQIDTLNVEVGDVVKKGDVLASIDATTAQARVDANKAQMISSQTNLLTQQTNLEKAKRDYQRQVNLKAADATTEEALLNAKTTLENAERQITTSKATIAQQEANMRIEANNLNFTKIVAPIDGTVMTIAVKEGQTVNATQNVPNVMRIANLSTMTVQSEVSEADVAKLYKGIPVYFTTLGGNNRRWYGTLKRIEPTPKVQNSVVLYNALFDVENEGGNLMPSMTAQVYFVSAEAKGVLLVPMAALQQGQQIARALAEKARKDNAAAPGAAAKPAAAGAPPAAGATATAAREGAASGAAVAANAGATPPAGAAARPAAPGAPGASGQGARPAGQPGGGAAAGGQRPGGAGGFPGFNGQSLTPEQQEQFRRMREQRMAAGGQAGQAGGFGGFGQRGAGGFGQRPGGGNGFGGMGAAQGGAGMARQPQQRRGTVMVKKADGTLEARPVVVGVTDRVHGQVISGLKEGEEVVVGKREPEAQAASAPRNNNNNQNFQGNRPNQGGFPGGGGNFRPF